MQLFHVSEQGGLEVFEPRIPSNRDSGVSNPVVWAVDHDHLPNYLLPRDCPRVCFRGGPKTSAEDRDRHLSPGAPSPVVAIDASWFAKASTTPLWLYEFPSATFTCADGNAGYFVSAIAVKTIGRRQILNPLAELLENGVELRVVQYLRSLADTITCSSLAFSCIRLRNLPRHPS